MRTFACCICILNLAACGEAFVGPSARVLLPVRHQLSMGLLETFGGWLLAIKEQPTGKTVSYDSDEYKRAAALTLSPQEGDLDVQCAKTVDEWLDAPMFATPDKRRHPISPEQAWDGTRPPIPNLRRFEDESKMEATYGRGKFREEVWNSVINPKNEWWRQYEPSIEEAAAMMQGYYNYEKREDWFEVRAESHPKQTFCNAPF